MDLLPSCIIVDDDPFATQALESLIAQSGQLSLAGVFGLATEALTAMNEVVPDILFLDIEMPDLTGLEMLQALHKQPYTIVVTSSANYAVQAYEQKANDYLVKPIDTARFMNSVARATAFVAQNTTATHKHAAKLFVKIDGQYIGILIEDILYVEAEGNYCKMVLAGGRAPLVYASMNELERKLGRLHFVRTHRSFIASLRHIDVFADDHVVIAQKAIPVGRLKKTEVENRLNILR